MAQLRYNRKTGVWMPSPEPRPAVHRYAEPEPLTRNKPKLTQIPVMPAYPLQPRIRMAMPDPRIQGPQYAKIPNRPVINQPRMSRMPATIREKGKWGQYTLGETVPEPKVLPKANLPRFHKFNANMIKREQARIDQKIRTRGGIIPASARNMASYTKTRRVKPKDLGINRTKGSNSKFLSFGSYLGRSIGNSL